MLSSGKSYNPNNDIEVFSPPEDATSHISFSPTADLLIAASWDQKVRLWEIQRQTAQTVPKHMVQHAAPVLCTAWSPDGSRFFSGSCDKQAKMTDVVTGQSSQVAQHDAPISTMKCFTSPQMGQILVTGSWDKTLKYWDLRTPNPVMTVAMSERVYCMDLIYPVMCVGLAERNVQIFNLENPSQVLRKVESLLKYPPRCIAIFPNRMGFGTGSIEGRSAIQNFEEPKEEAKKSFSYKCHREPDRSNECYSINSIAFHPAAPNYQTAWATAGADGWYCFWDKDTKSRLFRPNQKLDCSITSCAFNYDGTIFAYAVSYDWSKGHAYNNANLRNAILLKPVTEENIRQRKK